MSSSAPQAIDIDRIVKRSVQGVTRPFLCEAADGKMYWAKGALAGKRALCSEWMAGSLAQRLGLPVPPFACLFVSDDMLAHSLIDDVADLGGGMVFGSQDAGEVQEIGFEDVTRLMRKPHDVVGEVLLFDWWVQNGDRTLGEKGGNPNLLVTLPSQDIRVIDHNLAFHSDWSETDFFHNHVFGMARGRMDGDWLLAMRDKMRQLVTQIAPLWDTVPESWRFLDADMSMPVDFGPAEIQAVLNRVETRWRTWV